MTPATVAALYLPSLAGGGAERVTLNLAHALAERGLDVDLVLATPGGELAGAVPEGVRRVDLHAGRVARSVAPLARYLRSRRPALAIASLGHANLAAITARHLAGVAVGSERTRLVVTEHSTLDPRPHGARDRAFRLAARATYPRADAIVAVSRGVADAFAAATRLPRDRIDVVPNPVLGPAYWRAVRAPCPHPWFAPGEPPVVLTAGRLVPGKDVATLLRAFARVRAATPARLVVLGEGPERPALDRLAVQLGLRQGQDVALPGFVPNPYPWMAAAGAFVLASRKEGLPTVLIEALAAGTPVVSTDCASGPAEILAGGRWGALVPVGDDAALADAILGALARPRTPPPTSAWRPYTPDAAADAYLRAAGLADVIPTRDAARRDGATQRSSPAEAADRAP